MLRQPFRQCRPSRSISLACKAQQQATASVTATPPGACPIHLLHDVLSIDLRSWLSQCECDPIAGLATQPWTGTPEEEQAGHHRAALHHSMHASGADSDFILYGSVCRLYTLFNHQSDAWDANVALQALAELGQRMAASPVDTPDHETQRWFLRDRKFNVDEAVEKLESAQRWRREFRCI